MKARRVGVLVAIIALGLMLSACSDSDSSDPTVTTEAAETTSETTATTAATDEPSETTAPSADPVTLDFWTVTLNDTQKESITAIIDGFQAANPTITVNLEERDIDTHKEALRTAAGTEAEPDMYFMWTGLGLGGEFVNADVSTDLADIYAEFGWDDRFVAPALSSVQQYGGYHGVPWSQRGEVVYYRTDLFEQAGITAEPTTYEELLAVNESLLAAGITPFEFGGTVDWHVMRLLDVLVETACGADTHDALKSLEASWSEEPCATDAFVEFKKWSDDYLNEGFIGIDNDEATQLLYAGIAAMSIEGDWMNGVLKANADISQYGVFPFPTGTGRLYGFTEAIYFGQQSQHQHEAAMFMDYLTSDAVQVEHYQSFGSLSVNKNVEPASTEPLDQEWVQIFADSAGLYLNGDQALSLANTTEYWRIQNAIAIDDIDPLNAGSDFQTFIDANS